MSGIKSILADTNILIYFLEGRPEVSYYQFSTFHISVITEIELLGVKTIEGISMKDRRNIIKHCIILPFDDDVKETTIQIKQHTKIKTPDAIIAATAIKYQLPFVTADKGFTRIDGLNLILLEL